MNFILYKSWNKYLLCLLQLCFDNYIISKFIEMVVDHINTPIIIFRSRKV